MRQTATAQHLAPMWEPETLLPSQLGDNSGRSHCPELRLVSAIFEDALQSVLHHADARRGRKRREFLAACDWFWSDDCHWPFAFSNLCDLLAIDRSAVRETLRAHIVAQRAATGVHATRQWSRRALRGSHTRALQPRARTLYDLTMWDEV